jgi:hypothetical protein
VGAALTCAWVARDTAPANTGKADADATVALIAKHAPTVMQAAATRTDRALSSLIVLPPCSSRADQSSPARQAMQGSLRDGDGAPHPYAATCPMGGRVHEALGAGERMRHWLATWVLRLAVTLDPQRVKSQGPWPDDAQTFRVIWSRCACAGPPPNARSRTTGLLADEGLT